MPGGGHQREQFDYILGKISEAIQQRDGKELTVFLGMLKSLLGLFVSQSEKIIKRTCENDRRKVINGFDKHKNLGTSDRDQWREFLLSFVYVFRRLNFSHVDDFKNMYKLFHLYQIVFRFTVSTDTNRIPPACATYWCLPPLVYLLDFVYNSAVQVGCSADMETVQNFAREARQLILFCQKITLIEKAVPPLVNTMLSVFLASFNLEQCRALLVGIATMERQGFSLRAVSDDSQRVAYDFYLGRMRLYETNFVGAATSLYSAFVAIQNTSEKHINSSLVLYYLTVAQLCNGVLTPAHLLQKYALLDLLTFVKALRSANYSDFETCLLINQAQLREKGVYALLYHMLSSLHVVMLRRVHYVHIKIGLDPSRIRLEYIARMMILLGTSESETTEEAVFSLLAPLVSSGLIKGYISQEHKILVLSKTNPFPSRLALLE